MNIDSDSTLESNEIYNESENELILNQNENDDDENEKLIDDDINDEEMIIQEETKETKEKKICGYNKFKEEIGKLDVDSFDRTSEYSYETIPEIREEKKSINYLYIISFIIGLFLIYYFYSGNIFITIIELLLNAIFPYIYIVIKLFLIKGELVKKIKGIETNK
tara:strand:- start:629 stop:1120 length:492 start_codon:yes stop_codon:yes gene_type:complete